MGYTIKLLLYILKKCRLYNVQKAFGMCAAITISFVPIPFDGKSISEHQFYEGVDFAVEGKFREAKEKFAFSLAADQFYESARAGLKFIDRVIRNEVAADTAIRLFKGIDYRKKRKYSRALLECNAAIEIEPKIAYAYIIRGNIYHSMRQYAKCSLEYGKAINADPSYALAYYNRALIYQYGGKYEEALIDYSKAILINPELLWAYNNRGIVFLAQGKYAKAVLDFTKAIELNPSFASGYENRGHTLMLMGNYGAGCVDGAVNLIV